MQIFFSTLLGACVFFLINLWQTNSNIFCAKNNPKFILPVRMLLGVSIILLHYYLTKDIFSINYSTKYLHLFLVVMLCMSITPIVAKKSSIQYWQFNKFLLLRIFARGCFTTLTIVGIWIAFIMMDYLLEFFSIYKAYLNVAFIGWFIVFPVIFLYKFPSVLKK